MFMKRQLLFLLICCAGLSCEEEQNNCPDAGKLVGIWSRETVFLNGVNSAAYVDFLNNGTNFLDLKTNKSFARAYDNGTWRLSGRLLKLERDATSGIGDWTYDILSLTETSLTLETRMNESQYCCGFEAFSDNEIIAIKEVYSRVE